MTEYTGYKTKSIEILKKNNVKVGDAIKIKADLSYEGILMPRYEHSEDSHIVLKLKNGYNIGIEIDKIKKIDFLESKLEVKKEFSEKRKKNQSLPSILLLSTGGTIASKIDYRTGAVTPILSASELNESVPELSDIANIETEVIFSEYSENLQPEHWKSIAEKLDSYSKSDFKGIIIAHGTDTMHYTASFLSFALSGFPIPIVLVGSQRSSDRPSSDAALNLIAASKFISETNTNGVFVIMHLNENDNEIACHLGTRVRKNHTSKRGAFQTIGNDPAFLIIDGKIFQNFKNNYFQEKEYNPKIHVDTRVGLIKYHPGLNSKIIEHMIKSDYKAIIFEGTGLGHVARTLYDVIKKANSRGIFLGMTSQCIDGRVRMTVYESGRDLLEMSITPLDNMIPETALVKAMWALGNSNDLQEMKNIMCRKIASEISD